jgi:hypothetical protein
VSNRKTKRPPNSGGRYTFIPSINISQVGTLVKGKRSGSTPGFIVRGFGKP